MNITSAKSVYRQEKIMEKAGNPELLEKLKLHQEWLESLGN
jgi:hypothetical protein